MEGILCFYPSDKNFIFQIGWVAFLPLFLTCGCLKRNYKKEKMEYIEPVSGEICRKAYKDEKI